MPGLFDALLKGQGATPTGGTPVEGQGILALLQQTSPEQTMANFSAPATGGLSGTPEFDQYLKDISTIGYGSPLGQAQAAQVQAAQAQPQALSAAAQGASPAAGLMGQSGLLAQDWYRAMPDHMKRQILDEQSGYGRDRKFR